MLTTPLKWPHFASQVTFSYQFFIEGYPSKVTAPLSWPAESGCKGGHFGGVPGYFGAIKIPSLIAPSTNEFDKSTYYISGLEKKYGCFL